MVTSEHLPANPRQLCGILLSYWQGEEWLLVEMVESTNLVRLRQEMRVSCLQQEPFQLHVWKLQRNCHFCSSTSQCSALHGTCFYTWPSTVEASLAPTGTRAAALPQPMPCHGCADTTWLVALGRPSVPNVLLQPLQSWCRWGASILQQDPLQRVRTATPNYRFVSR